MASIQDEKDAQLRKAAAQDDVRSVQQLVAAGANPYAVDEEGRTAFNCAASNGLSALAWMTEQAFEDTQKPKDQRRWPDFELNTPSGAYGSTLITYAAKVCPVDVVRKMIGAGADITIINGSGWTLLHAAAVMPGRTDVLPELIKAFRAAGLENLINARSTHEYVTSYNGNRVIYGAQLTATELCQQRIEQDPGCPPELQDYKRILNASGSGHLLAAPSQPKI